MTQNARRSMAALTILGVLAFAVPFAHAGGGMGTGSGTTSCRLIPNAVQQPQTLSITDAVTDAVKIGSAVLLCITATGETLSGPETQPLTLSQNATACYAVAAADATKFPTTFTDPFGTQSVIATKIQLVCVPAHIHP